MEIRTYAELGLAAWDSFCHDSRNAWFWHTSSFIEYSVAHQPDLRSENLSFALVENGKVVAVCPLLIEEHSASDYLPLHRELTFSGSYGPQPAFASDIPRSVVQRAQKVAFNQVRLIASKQNAVKVAMRSVPVTGLISGEPPENILSRFGFLDTSISSQYIDLSNDIDTIFHGFSKGHRSAIKRDSGRLEISIHTSDQVTDELFRSYRQLHAEASGRVTRPAATFQMMQQWVRSGLAILVSAKLNNEFVGFSLLLTYGQIAYYGSACNKPGLHDIGISHQLQWATVQWLKQHGYSHYEVGWHQHSPALFEIPTTKESNIMKFKQGFGGHLIPFHRGELYLNADFLQQEMKHRIDEYAAYLRRSV